MNDVLHELTLVLADRSVEGVWDRTRRYCGLSWSGGSRETWAYRYYDALDTGSAWITPVDVLSAAALHPGLSRADLAYFWERLDQLNDWLGVLPNDLTLRDADDAVLAHLRQLPNWPDAPSLTLLSKVLHRKRPALIPLVDRHILDWYRPATGERAACAAWPPLLGSLRADLGGQNAIRLAMMNAELEKELGRPLTHLRLVDIAIWMGGRM